MAQPFLKAGEQRLFIAGLDMDHPVGRQTSLGDRRGEKIGSGYDPENLAFCARCYPRREQRGGGAIDGAIPASGHLMQASQPQTSSRKPAVDRGDTEWQDLARTASTAVHVRNALLELSNDSVYRAIGHVSPVLLRALQRLKALLCSLFVPFPIMSQSDSAMSLSGADGDETEATAQYWPIVVDSQGDRSGTE